MARRLKTMMNAINKHWGEFGYSAEIQRIERDSSRSLSNGIRTSDGTRVGNILTLTKNGEYVDEWDTTNPYHKNMKTHVDLSHIAETNNLPELWENMYQEKEEWYRS